MAKLVLEENGERRVFRLGDGILTVGSGEGAKLKLASDGVAEVHLDLEIHGDTIRVLPRKGVMPPTVGGQPVSAPTDVAAGTDIRVGGATIRIEDENAPAAPAAAPASPAVKKKRGPARNYGNRSVVKHRRTVQRGLPSGLIIGIVIAVVVVGFFLFKYAFESTAEKGTGSVQSAIWKAQREIDNGNFEYAEEALDTIPAVLERTPAQNAEIAQLRTDIRERRESAELAVYNLRGTKFLDVALKKYEEKWLSGTPDKAKVRLFLMRLAEFRERWPKHPDMDWVERQEKRFRGFVDINAPPDWEDVDWEIKYLVAQPVRDYKRSFELLDRFLGIAGGEVLLEAQELRDKLVEERKLYHEDKMQQARYELEKKENTQMAVWWLLNDVVYSGDEEMANESAGYLVKLPKAEIHLEAYERDDPERFEAVMRHPTVRAFAKEKGLID